ncbi:MAG: DUF2007 domain-containing protein [Deltaproteobacteria bacterium]|nr:DUF2007 domain-containing protein [Deltaproteobacteria bacterium]
MMENDFTEYEILLETHNAGDRVFIKSILDAEGIIYFIQNEYVAPYLFNALPMKVMVKKDQIGKAKEILKDIKLSYTYNLRDKTKDTNNDPED